MILVAALALAAAALGPAAVLGCWSERATARGAAAGATAGVAVFVLVAAGGAAGPDVLMEARGSILVAAPAVVAAPVHFLVAWFLRSRRRPSPRGPLPPGAEGPSVPLPGPPAG